MKSLTDFDNTYEIDLLGLTDIELTYLNFDNLNTNCELIEMVLILFSLTPRLGSMPPSKPIMVEGKRAFRKMFDIKLDSLYAKTKRGYNIAISNFW